MGKVFAVCGKGGAGKSTMCANVAAAMSATGKKVLTADFDCGVRSLELYCGADGSAAYNFADVMHGDCTVAEAVTRLEHGTELMPPPPTLAFEEYDGLARLVGSLKSTYDYVFIDCPDSPGTYLEAILKACDCALVVTEPTYSSVRAADFFASLAEKSGCSENFLIINKISIDIIKKNGMINIEEILKISALPVAGVCPSDERLLTYAQQGVPAFTDKSSACREPFYNTALRLTGVKVPVSVFKKLFMKG